MIFAVGLVVAFIILLLFNMKNRDRRLCRWREYRQGETSQWRCIHCGATTDGTPGEAPKLCFRERG
ncbi:hypothetical protein KUV62_06165 [Salipiger bermudensis]|uniref:hypothetical protein n=1 Tax=Salipiger bermudensis TaxID=344736 RepID=UPI001C994BD9|nr:hypothetical protein [Salipiger bermudensis]MBY6003481.1 hypothetical protein [Salipiger bermudensis]